MESHAETSGQVKEKHAPILSGNKDFLNCKNYLMIYASQMLEMWGPKVTSNNENTVPLEYRNHSFDFVSHIYTLTFHYIIGSVETNAVIFFFTEVVRV